MSITKFANINHQLGKLSRNVSDLISLGKKFTNDFFILIVPAIGVFVYFSKNHKNNQTQEASTNLEQITSKFWREVTTARATCKFQLQYTMFYIHISFPALHDFIKSVFSMFVASNIIIILEPICFP